MQKNCFNYPVEFAEDVFGDSTVLSDTLKKITGSDAPRILIVADMNVVQRNEGLGSKIGRYVQEHGIRLAASPVVIAGGEKAKADSLQSALRIVTAVLSAKLGRNDVVLAIGGGTILDIAGYAAAQVRGGVRIVRMPTTPAAMMDAAFAEYAAVDSATIKDALRVPCIPAAVIIDPGFALSVLDGVWRGGIGEAVRYAVAKDSALLKKLVKLMPDYRDRSAQALKDMVQAVYASHAKKGNSQFAQWAAFRLESMSGYKLPHGYAVSIAVSIDCGYAVEKGALKPADRDLVMKVLEESGALDGLAHSVHLLNQVENLLFGLDAWALSSEGGGIIVLAGLGKEKSDPDFDRAAFGQVLKNLVSSPAKA